MPSNPYQLPIQSGRTTARKVAENAQGSSTNFNTGLITFTAVKSYEFYTLPEELNEDSAVNFLAIGRKDVINAQLRAIETAIINGDTTATHMDSDTNALGADVAEKFWKGLRKLALANSANGGTSDNSGTAISDAF